ncbi:glycosyltransferase family 39 protein [Candidatus Omnitrophota bacterium]
MKPEGYRFSYKVVIMLLWAACAFLLLVSPLSKGAYFKLAFRHIAIPVFYWLWAILGFFSLKALLKDSRKAAGDFLLCCILFHVGALMSVLLANGNIYDHISGPYLFYIYAFIYAFQLSVSWWAVHPAFDAEKRERSLARAPLAALPLFCVLFSLFRSNPQGIVVFGLSVMSLAGASFARGPVTRSLNAVTGGLRSLRKNRFALIIAIFLAAFLARAAFSAVVITKTGPDYILASDDGDAYDQAAQDIARDPKNAMKTLLKQPWPPVYMVFLSAVYGIFGRNFYAAGIFQAFLGALIAVMVYIMGKRLFNETTGIIAGFLVALSQPLIFVSSVLGTESVYIPLIIAAIYFFLDAVSFSKERVAGKLALSGALFALAAMTLASITLFPAAAAVFMIARRKPDRPLLKRLKAALIFLAGFLAVFFFIRGAYVLEAGSLESLYETEGSAFWGIPTAHSYDIDPDNRKFIALGIDPFKDTAGSLKIALKNWKEVISIGLEVFPVRIKNFFLWGTFGFFDPIFLVNAERLPNVFNPALEFYALLFFFIGFLFSLRRSPRRDGIAFILLFVCYYVFIHAIMFTSHTLRYGCPVKPFMILFLAYGLDMGFKFFKRYS